MASKFCINCGTALVEAAKFCPECGTPVAAVSPAAANAWQVAPEAQPAPAYQPVSQVQPEPAYATTPVPKRSKAPLFIALGAAAAVITVTVVLIFVLLNRGKPITMPYGITAGMTSYESRGQMTEYGFREDWKSNSETAVTVFYDSSVVLGYMTDFTSMRHTDDNEYIDITHYYTEAGYNTYNEGPKFLNIKSRIIDEYGKPDDVSDRFYYQWYDGDYKISLSYYDDEEGNFAVTYLYIEGSGDDR